jgi:hypothetical protein
VIAAYYHYIQNSYFGTPTGGPTPCSGAEHPQCAGTFDAISAAVDWRFAPKWDLYSGIMFTQVNGGLAFGFLQRNNIAPTVGLRFRFRKLATTDLWAVLRTAALTQITLRAKHDGPRRPCAGPGRSGIDRGPRTGPTLGRPRPRWRLEQV